jgi:hypothetical protein
MTKAVTQARATNNKSSARTLTRLTLVPSSRLRAGRDHYHAFSCDMAYRAGGGGNGSLRYFRPAITGGLRPTQAVGRSDGVGGEGARLPLPLPFWTCYARG